MSGKRLKPKGPSTIYHVMTRTAQQVHWLRDPEIKEIFLDLIDFYSKVFYVKIFAQTPMDNHYHLALEVQNPTYDEDDVRRRFELAQTRLKYPRKYHRALAGKYHRRYTDLSAFMWQINKAMAKIHNKLKGTHGHLWGRRFKSIVVENDQHLLTLMAYIENNPVRAGIVEDPTAYAFSSVGRMKIALDKGQFVSVPPVGFLSRIPEKRRAVAYMTFIRYTALLLKTPELRREPFPLALSEATGTLDMEAVCKDLEGRAPADWGNQLYGSEAFQKKQLENAGWLVRFPNCKAVRKLGQVKVCSEKQLEGKERAG